MIKNPGKREIEKLKLNSLWGFFALNSNKAQFKIITNRASLENLLNDDQYVIHDIDFNDENFAQVTYSIKEEYCTGNLSTNVILANFVTAQGRLKLYEELEKLNHRVLYFDTVKKKQIKFNKIISNNFENFYIISQDSIFFVSQEGDYMPKLGEFLGDFTNELDGDDYITEFASGG